MSTGILPLIVTGKQVPALLGTSVLKLSAFTCRGETAVPVVFQADDVNAEGRHVPNDPSERIARDETPGVLDENDEIVFMLKDLEGECSAERLAQARGKLVTIRARASYLKKPAVVHLLVGETGFVPDKSYVRYFPVTHLASTSAYSIGYIPEKPFLFNRFATSDLKGRQSEDILDRVKIRFRAKPIGSLPSLNVNEDQIDATLDGSRVGPVRVVREISAGVTVLGVTTPTISRIDHYDRLIRIDIRFRPPQLAALTVSSLDIMFLLDLIDLKGLRLSTSALPQGAVVDGKVIESEKSIEFGPEPWFMTTGLGLNQMGVVDLDPALRKNLKAEAVFLDDAELSDPPEEFRGSLPGIGYYFRGWENLKTEWYHIGANIASLPAFPERGGSGFYKVLHEPLEIEAVERQ
ncbi:MAG: hypothetical protein AB1405_12960 [Bdellovibrionota bacterium]